MKPGGGGGSQRLSRYGFAAPALRWPASAFTSAAIPGALPAAARTRSGGSTSAAPTAARAGANMTAQGDSDTICCRVVVNDRVKVEKTSERVNAQILCSVKSA